MKNFVSITTRRIAALVVLVFFVGALLTACGSSATSSNPRLGGTFRLGLSNVDSLDPADASSIEELLVADQLFDGLTRWDPISLEPISSIAKAWSASPDQKTFDFTLRTDATFSNGRLVTAADIKYSMERVSRKDSTSPFAELLTPVAGYIGWHVDADLAGLAGVAVIDAQHLRISLDEPWSVLPSVLASPIFGTVARESVEQASPPFAEQPVGSGPFSFSSRDSDGTLTFAATTSGGAHVDDLEIHMYGSQETSYEAFTNGDVDWSRVPPALSSVAAKKYGDSAMRPYFAVLYYGVNLKNPELSDRRFREAIVRSIDREKIASDVFGNTVNAITGVVPKGVPGAQSDPCRSRCGYDATLAADLIKQSYTLRAPPAVYLDYDKDPTQEAIATAMRDGLAQAGIPATLRPHEPQEYGAFVQGGQASLFRLGWTANYPSADAFLTPLFRSNESGNLVGLKDPDVDAALTKGRSVADAGARDNAYQLAEAQIMDQFAVIPVAQFKLFSVENKKVHDLTVTGMGTFDATKVWLS